MTESTSRFEDVVEALDAGIVTLDRQRRVERWNAWMARASGVTPREVVGRPLWDAFPQLRGTRLETAIEDALDAGAPSLLSHTLHGTLLPLRRPDGNPLLHDLLVRPLSSGQQRCCLIQVNDVTAAVERERFLRERRNARYRAVVDTASDAIVTTSIDGRIQWLNRAAERQFGYDAHEAAGQDIGLVLVEGDVAAWPRGASAMTLTQRGAKPIESAGRRKDGSQVDLELSVDRWSDGSRWFVTGIMRDVTERRRAQQVLAARELAMRQLAEQTRATLDALPAFVAVLDRSGRVLSINQPWADAMRSGEFPECSADLGDNYLDACRSGRTDLYPELKALLDDGGPPMAVEYASRAAGRSRWFRCLAAPLPSGPLGGAVVMHIDFTETKRMQEALQRALDDKLVLLSEINHRVKNSLQVVSSLLHLQSLTAADEGVRGHFEEARSRIHAIARVHQHLYQGGSFRTLNFADYLTDLAEEVARASGGQETFDLRIDAASVEVTTDQASSLGLIANELITNAIKHRGTGRASVDVALESVTGGLALTVSDEGPGLPEGFDPERSRSVGMRIVTSLIRQLGGTLEVLPRVRGAAFRATVPLGERGHADLAPVGGRTVTSSSSN